MMFKEVLVTGAGIVSAVGSGLAAHLDAVAGGRSGIGTHLFFNGELPDPCMCGKVPEHIVSGSIDGTAADRALLLADNAIRQTFDNTDAMAVSDADLVVGTTLGNMHGGTLYYRGIRNNETPSVDLVKHVMPDSVGNVLAKKYGIGGRHMTVSSACASGTTAIGTAFNRLVRGHCDCAIAGGVDALSPFVIAGFNCLRLLSKNRCRPFSGSRDGLNPGEGAAFVMLENSATVKKRDCNPVARITGFGTALEAFHYTKSHPEGTGVSSAIRKALDRSGLAVNQIDHIHAHGTATVLNDISEYNGFLNVFGDRLSEIPVCSSKSMTGHTYGAAGAISVVLTILAINNSIIPATLFCDDRDTQFTKLNVSDVPRAHKVKRALSVALGFGGEVAALVVEAV